MVLSIVEEGLTTTKETSPQNNFGIIVGQLVGQMANHVDVVAQIQAMFKDVAPERVEAIYRASLGIFANVTASIAENH